MAPIPDGAYFPSLDNFFEGDQLLMPWRTACFVLLRNDKTAVTNTSALDNFFSDPAVLELLAHPFKAFSAPNQQTKSAFETKTSAINVTPSSVTRYDIKEVKEDALWLSKEAKIDEVSALRIVIVECQGRPSGRLLEQFSNKEAERTYQAALPGQASTTLLPQIADPEAVRDEFNSQECRRLRIVRIYLSERRSLLQCLGRILQDFLYPSRDDSSIGKGKSTSELVSWVRGIGKTVWQKMGDHGEWVLEALFAIRTNIGHMEDSSKWFQTDVGRQEIEMEWIKNQIMEVSYTMEVIFQIVDSHPNPSSSTVIIAWLELMEQYGFFDQYPLEDPTSEALFSSVKLAATFISLCILSPVGCIDFLRNLGNDPRISPDAPRDLPYILNLTTVARVHTTLMRVSDEIPMSAAPMVLAWADILQTFSMRVAENAIAIDEEGSQQEPPGDSFEATVNNMLEELSDEAIDVIQYLASTAADRGCVFQYLTDLGLRLGGTSNSYFSATIGARMRIAILDLIHCSSVVGYIPELVEACLSALVGGQTYWDVLDAPLSHPGCDPLAHFLANADLVELILSSARNRFPYETALLKLTRPLSTCYLNDGSSMVPLILREIGTIFTITCRLPDDFAGYITTQEEENNNSIQLTIPLNLFEVGVRMRGLHRSTSALIQADNDFILPVGTYGRMISDSPKVAYWGHQYSGLKYFGKMLETFLAAGDVVDAFTGGPTDRDLVADIIGMFGGLFQGSFKAAENDQDAAPHLKSEVRQILESASTGMAQNRDIMSVVFDIFEEELQRQSTDPGSDVSLEVLISCVQFIHSILPFYSSRVWPLISRSGLLELGRGVGRLSTIVASVELVSGRFDLLLSCMRLYEALVEDIVSKAVQRRNVEKAGARFGNEDLLETGTVVLDPILSKVLLSFTRYFVDVLESSHTWRFAVQDDRRRLRKTIATIFNQILRFAYGIDGQHHLCVGMDVKFMDEVIVKTVTGTQAKLAAAKKSKSGIMTALLAAASHLVISFLSTPSSTLRFQPLLESLHDGFNSPPSVNFINGISLCVDQVNATLLLLTTLMRVGVSNGRPHCQLETELFKTSSLLTRLYAINEAYQLAVVQLFEALITSASKDSSEPPSLLGYLGTKTSKNFLQVLADLDKPLCRQVCTTAIWQFLAVIVSNRQQWFANYLLTGLGSNHAMKTKAGGKEPKALARPLLESALDALSSMSTIFKADALAMLDFVALAQNFWPWATYSSTKHAAFIKSIIEYVGTLKPIQPSTKLDDSIDACYQTRIAGYIAEILAMHLFHHRQTGDKISTKDIIPNLGYFTRFAVAVPSYNSSLHGNLKRNFEARYPGCSILDFERTTLEQRPLGREYFYNYPILNQTLGYDKNWRRPDGLATEVANANVNLSLVDAQIALLHGWSFLAIELSADLSNQLDLQKILAKMSSDCLISNKRTHGLEEIFLRLNQRRAELAVTIIQRLIESKINKKEIEGLLGIVWDTIQHSEITFERALLTGNVEYYRTLLKLLFLALRVHADTGEAEKTGQDFRSSKGLRESSSVVPIVMALLDAVVANGIRELATFIHDKPAESNPEDVALVTGILQACLRIPSLGFCYPQIASIFMANDSARVAVTLFSWSHSLAIEGDPVYGELSMLFLLELSTIPPVAEQLAIDGVLGQISGANVTGYLRSSIVNPLSDSAGNQRCYSIWVRGMLPLLLNILSAVGDAIGTEIALFINQFPNLLKQSSEAFDTPETSRTLPRGTFKHITLSMCSEIHSLSLIMYILRGFRQSDRGADIPDVKWDISNILEGVEFWLSSRLLLKERILPIGERAAYTRNSNGSTILEEKVLSELAGIKDVLTELSGGS